MSSLLVFPYLLGELFLPCELCRRTFRGLYQYHNQIETSRVKRVFRSNRIWLLVVLILRFVLPPGKHYTPSKINTADLEPQPLHLQGLSFLKQHRHWPTTRNVSPSHSLYFPPAPAPDISRYSSFCNLVLGFLGYFLDAVVRYIRYNGILLTGDNSFDLLSEISFTSILSIRPRPHVNFVGDDWYQYR